MGAWRVALRWCVVRGARCVVLGAWVRGAWVWARGAWRVVCCAWSYVSCTFVKQRWQDAKARPAASLPTALETCIFLNSRITSYNPRVPSLPASDASCFFEPLLVGRDHRGSSPSASQFHRQSASGRRSSRIPAHPFSQCTRECYSHIEGKWNQ